MNEDKNQKLVKDFINTYERMYEERHSNWFIKKIQRNNELMEKEYKTDDEQEELKEHQLFFQKWNDKMLENHKAVNDLKELNIEIPDFLSLALIPDR